MIESDGIAQMQTPVLRKIGAMAAFQKNTPRSAGLGGCLAHRIASRLIRLLAMVIGDLARCQWLEAEAAP
jgi:hypothetical protein